MRNKYKPIAYMFLSLLKDRKVISSFLFTQPSYKLFNKRVTIYNGRKMFRLRVRPPFRTFKFRSFIQNRVRGSRLRKFFSKTLKKKK